MLIFYLRISQITVCHKRDSKVFTNETFHQDKRNKKCRTPLPSSPRFPALPHRPRVGAAKTKKKFLHRQLAPFNQALDSAIYWINHYPGGLINSKIKDTVILPTFLNKVHLFAENVEFKLLIEIRFLLKPKRSVCKAHAA